MENKKSAYLIVIVFGLLVFGISVNEVLSKYQFNSKSILTKATVLESKTYGSKNRSIQQTISFVTAEGKVDTVILLDIHNQYLPEGSVIQVFYDPKNPKRVTTGKLTNNYIGVLLGGLLLIYGLISYRTEVVREKTSKQKPKQA
jgi:uncharacterized membrane protein